MFARGMSFIMHKHPENALRDLKELCNPISSKQNRPHIISTVLCMPQKHEGSLSALNTEPPQGAAAMNEAESTHKSRDFAFTYVQNICFSIHAITCIRH